MGDNLFMILSGTLFFILATELFSNWYRKYLVRRKFPVSIRRSMEKIKWVLLSLVFWNLLYRRSLPDEFDLSHLLFALFIFSLRGFTLSIIRQN